MSDWRAKRFWKEATIGAQDGGYAIFLDGRPVRTPAKLPLAVPTARLAEAIADEWAAQQDLLDPSTMPMTRSANAAIDKVTTQVSEVAEMLAAYAETDLVCHRADDPEALTLAQAEAWDPLLDWCGAALRAPLRPVFGIIAEPQPAQSLTNLRARLQDEDAFAITALHDLVSLSGSLVIGLATIDEVLPPEELWRRSRIDETWQESQWGVDEEAAVAASQKREAFLHAANFHRWSRAA